MGAAVAASIALMSVPAAAQATPAYVIQQEAAGSVTRLILAPSGLRFDYYLPVRAGGKRRGRHAKPLIGLIIRYRDASLVLLDPVHRAYQIVSLTGAISGYARELNVLAHAQPSVKLPPRPGSQPAPGGQAPLTSPPARLTRLSLSVRIGPVRAQAYLLRQGTLRERLWYSSALPAPPAAIRSLLAQALVQSASGPLDRVLRAHAAEIPLRIDELSGKSWHTVLRTPSIRRVPSTARTLSPPRSYRKTTVLAFPTGPKKRPADTPANPIRCALHPITGSLLCNNEVFDALDPLTGPISSNPAIWAYYWGSGWSSHLDYVAALNHGLENMVGDQFADPSSTDFYRPLAQYGINPGRFLGYTVVDQNPDASVGSWNFFDIEWFVLTHRWGSDAPHYWWRWSGEDPIFAIFVDGSKVDSSGWQGYHFFAPTEGILFAFLVHPAMPWFIVKTPALDSLPSDHESTAWQDAVDAATEPASHEFVEAATDPYPFTSWADPFKEPIWENGEISDICQQGNHSPWGSDTRTAPYGTAFEPYWSNDAQACVPDAQPSAQIVSPATGASYPWDSPVTFQVITNDLFDHGPVQNITWYDNGTEIAAERDRDYFVTRSLSPGNHRITATAEDSVGGIRTSDPVTVNIVAQPPTVTIDKPVDGASFGSDQTINFVGSATDPGQGDLGPSATWSVDGTPVGTGASLFQYRIATQGTHTVRLSATNGIGLSSSASITVNIGPPTGKPTVSITQPTNGYQAGANTQVTFSAAATASGSATITGYSWDFGDGSGGAGQNVMHNYPLSCNGPVPYQVTVTARDSNGATATDTITIYVGVIAC
jgi:hypothetical protein